MKGTAASPISSSGWGVPLPVVAQYRKRLIDAGIIGKRARGLVGFDLPYFRDYLQEKLDNGELLLEN